MKKQRNYAVPVAAAVAAFMVWLRADQCLTQFTVQTPSQTVINGAYAEWSQPFYSQGVTLRVYSQTSVPRNVRIREHVWFATNRAPLVVVDQTYVATRSAGLSDFLNICLPSTNYTKVQLFIDVSTTNGVLIGSNWVKAEQSPTDM